VADIMLVNMYAFFHVTNFLVVGYALSVCHKSLTVNP